MHKTLPLSMIEDIKEMSNSADEYEKSLIGDMKQKLANIEDNSKLEIDKRQNAQKR